MEMGPHKDREKLRPGWNWIHKTFGLDYRCMLYRLSYKVRGEQAVGTEDIKVTAMNIYKYKEGLVRRFTNVGRVALLFQQT